MEQNENEVRNQDAAQTAAKPSVSKRTKRFIGSYNHTMDAKGRLVIPQSFRDKLGDTFCIAPSLDFSSIAIYPNEMFEKKCEAYEELGNFDPELNEYLEQFYALSFDEQECDGQGRVLLPAIIRQKILEDEKEVEITGANDHVRIVATNAGNATWKNFKTNLPSMLQKISDLEKQKRQGKGDDR